jgi:hypothetical protein
MQLRNSSGHGLDFETILAPERGPGSLVVQASDDYDGDFDLDFDIGESDDEDEDEDDDEDDDDDKDDDEKDDKDEEYFYGEDEADDG